MINYSRNIKPRLDFFAALIILLFVTPLIVIIVLFYFLIGERIIFKQERTGYQMKKFTLYKFKTLRENDKMSINWFGNMLRMTSLDELPQLVNVLKGNMSIIGPRPLLPEYDQLYQANHLFRFNVKPGITGLVQVSGRNMLSWENRLNLDVQYVKQQSFLLDAKIFLKTFLSLFRWHEASSFEKYQGHN